MKFGLVVRCIMVRKFSFVLFKIIKRWAVRFKKQGLEGFYSF